MKKDALSAAIIIVLIFGFAYALHAIRVPVPMRPTHPFSMDERQATIPVGAADQPAIGHVIMRVNGEPITEEEFSASFASLPQEIQAQFNSEQGKQAFAEQLVRMKLLEQEGRRMKVDRDPRVAGQISAGRTDVLAQAAAQKITPNPSAAEIQKFYNENQRQMQSVELSHIVVAYQGGMIPAKNGRPAPDERTAINKALQIYQAIKEGASFEEMARKESDDTASAARGGALGQVAPGMLPQELDARVMSLKEGEVSTAIPSRYGIHIFKRGAQHSVPLQQVQERITAKMKQDQTIKRIEELRKTAKVDFDPKFFPDAKNWTGSQPPRPGAGRPPA